SRTAAPGGSVAVRPRVRNTGARDVDGLVLVVIASDDALAGTDFGNCVYGLLLACTFDTTAAVGRTYQVSAPFTLRLPRDAVVGSQTGMSAQWLTVAEWEDWQAMWDGLPIGRQGTGPDLALRELVPPSASATRVPQADIDGHDNGTNTEVTVTGRRAADVAAIGATITGPAGSTSTVDVGLVNRGPGTLRYPPFFNNLPDVRVSLPQGVTVVQADERCSSLTDDEDPTWPAPSSAPRDPGLAEPQEFACLPDSIELRPGRRLSFRFTVQVAPGARNATGSIEVDLADDEVKVDRTTDNNTAPITLDLGGGEGGGLPITGTAPATVAGGGALLVLVGLVLTVALRRRTRFET
ncbi:MAG TPA: hypothetical protein VFO77_02050, partial [Actinoplanes sp.]|nr:hypothetical protein [Actinoplanes sp.]